MRILLARTRYGQTGEGDVKRLTESRRSVPAARRQIIDNRGQAYWILARARPLRPLLWQGIRWRYPPRLRALGSKL